MTQPKGVKTEVREALMESANQNKQGGIAVKLMEMALVALVSIVLAGGGSYFAIARTAVTEKRVIEIVESRLGAFSGVGEDVKEMRADLKEIKTSITELKIQVGVLQKKIGD